MEIDFAVSEALETNFRRHIKTILKQMHLPLKAVSIGGQYNEDGIVLSIGLVHEKSTEESSLLFTINRQNEGHELEYIQKENSYKGLITLTGLTFEQIDKLAKSSEKLDTKAQCGTVYKRNDAKYVCLGFSKKRDAFVMASMISGDCKYLPVGKLKNFTRLKAKFDIS